MNGPQQPTESALPPEPAEVVTVGVDDSRRVMAYLIASESDDYIAVMDVLEGSVTDLSPAEVTSSLAAAGRPIELKVVEARLEKLRDWTAVSARSDSTRILRYADLLARNWRYTATPAGRQVQRFYRTVLQGTAMVREIPITSLNRVVTSAEALAATCASGGPIDEESIDRIGVLFTSHDDLDGALVGAEEALAGLADRFDLDDDRTAELKKLLVDYATRLAADLETGSARAARALDALRHRFDDLAAAAVDASQAKALIEQGALTASRGGRSSDWEGLCAWFHPDTGRAARFSLRLVRSLPGMHANLRRLHTSSGAVSSRSRLLALARACADPAFGTQIFYGAVGDHPWRKLHGETDDDPGRNPSWRGGPTVEVPDLLRSSGRTGPRGRGGAARNDTEAKALVEAARQRRARQHAEAVSEVLAASAGEVLSDRAARAALEALMAAVRSAPSGARRTASRDGLACTLLYTGTGMRVLTAPNWRVLLPGRHLVFHLPGRRPNASALAALEKLALADDPDVGTNARIDVPDQTGQASTEATETIEGAV